MRTLHGPGRQHQRGPDGLPQQLVGQREAHGLRHGRVLVEHGVHLQRGDLLAAPVDELLEPPGELEVAVLGADVAL